jgi:lysozyme family protein
MSYSQAFIDALAVTAVIEGGYVNNPDDQGGETCYGITFNVARRFGYHGPMASMPFEIARRIYHDDYWKPILGDSLPPTIALHVFDAAVNCGVATATRMMQRALGVADDGYIGSVTMAALTRSDPVAFKARFAAERLIYYARLSGFKTFGRGWVRRVAKMLTT